MTQDPAGVAAAEALACDFCGVRACIRAVERGEDAGLPPGDEQGMPESAVWQLCISCQIAVSLWESGDIGDLPTA